MAHGLAGASRLGWFLLAGCAAPAEVPSHKKNDANDAPTWVEHVGEVDAVALLMEGRSEERLTLALTAETWAAVRDDLARVLAVGAGDESDVSDPVGARPAWFEGTVTFRGRAWERVRVRLKGNSTLARAAERGSWKLPWRLDFEHTPDERQFFGLARVSLANGARDDTLLRDLATSTWMRAFDVPAPRMRRLTLVLRVGATATPLGVYTLAELPGPALLDHAFGSAAGTLYEADGTAATLSDDDPAALAGAFAPERDGSDGSDLSAAVAALLRNPGDPRWQARVEAAWDVDGFLRWLAANTVLTNWDAYGVVAHNYYLSGDDAGRMRFLPWDFNEAMKDHPWLPRLDLADVGPRWPLVHDVLDDPVWRERYAGYVRAFAEGPLAHAEQDLATWHAEARASVLAEGVEHALVTPAAYDTSLAPLQAYVRARRDAARTFGRERDRTTVAADPREGPRRPRSGEGVTGGGGPPPVPRGVSERRTEMLVPAGGAPPRR